MRLQFEDIDECPYCVITPGHFIDLPHWDLGAQYVQPQVNICDYHDRLSHSSYIGKIFAQLLGRELDDDFSE